MLENIEIGIRSKIGEEGNVYGIHARKDGQLVGHAYGYINTNDNTAVLESLNVNLAERHKGVGSLLLAKFVECMVAEGVIEIAGEMKTEYGLHIAETKGFYEKNGFTVDEDRNLNRRL